MLRLSPGIGSVTLGPADLPRNLVSSLLSVSSTRSRISACIIVLLCVWILEIDSLTLVTRFRPHPGLTGSHLGCLIVLLAASCLGLIAGNGTVALLGCLRISLSGCVALRGRITLLGGIALVSRISLSAGISLLGGIPGICVSAGVPLRRIAALLAEGAPLAVDVSVLIHIIFLSAVRGFIGFFCFVSGLKTLNAYNNSI